MTQALLVSNAVLWMVVVLLGCVVAALARQIGVLHERVAPAGALMVGKGPAVGEPAPVVRVEDLTGTVHDSAGPAPGGGAHSPSSSPPPAPASRRPPRARARSRPAGAT